MLPAEGGCFCGAVRYRVSEAPRVSVICHCESCRKVAGSPSLAWVCFAGSAFTWVRGQPRSYSSSPGVERTFCERCGTPLTYATAHRPSDVDVTTGSLDEPGAFPPTREIWLEDRIAWEALDESRSAHSRSSA